MRQIQLDSMLVAMLGAYKNVSDINFTVGKFPQVEADGELVELKLYPGMEPLSAFQTESIALNLLGRDRRLYHTLIEEGSCDLSYRLGEEARFRINIFSQKGCYSIVMRRLAAKVPTFEELNLPESFARMTKDRNGIILVTGATGNGKTTSLAAVLDIINKTKPVHVVTLEDPVEYVHAQHKATFNQRELGVDFDSFASGLRAALRQAPKVILVGEMRDRETVNIGLTAAETGHLVFSTLHTISAGQTINRIIGMFDKKEEVMVRMRIADTIRWIVCQRLLPKVGGGRVAAFEILGGNLRTKDLIINGQSEGKTYYDIMESSRTFGMMTFEQSIADLFSAGLITEETALSYSNRKGVIGRAIDTIKSTRGEKTTTIESLAMDKAYGKKEDFI